MGWLEDFYEWGITKAEKLYGLSPLPRPLTGNLEKIFYERCNEGKLKKQKGE